MVDFGTFSTTGGDPNLVLVADDEACGILGCLGWLEMVQVDEDSKAKMEKQLLEVGWETPKVYHCVTR